METETETETETEGMVWGTSPASTAAPAPRWERGRDTFEGKARLVYTVCTHHR